ncbi:MAG: nucleoside deaminase [Pseudomonadota bacterium]
MSTTLFSKYMLLAIQQAKKALKNNEIPIGCILVNRLNPEQYFATCNTIQNSKNPIKHAEINAINLANKTIKQKYLNNFDMYITLEPCHMCAYAISLTHIPNIYFGAYNHKTGALCNDYNIYSFKSCTFKPNYFGGIYESQCQQLLDIFFTNKRNKKNKLT